MREAQIKLDERGVMWVVCPYCDKKLFPVSNKTSIQNLVYKCKANTCKNLLLVNISKEP